MRKIIKQELPLWVNQPFEIELEGTALNFKVEHNRIVVYYSMSCDTVGTEKYKILLAETGFILEDDWTFVDTLTMFNGDYELHCFVKLL